MCGRACGARPRLVLMVVVVPARASGLLVGPLSGTFWSGTTVLVASATGVGTAVGRAVVNRRPR